MSTSDKAAIVAAAIASAERETPEGFPEDETVYRVGYVNAALRHLAERVEHSEAEARALREALRKVQVCCQYTGTQQILMVAVDVKAIVDSALAAKAVVP